MTALQFEVELFWDKVPILGQIQTPLTVLQSGMELSRDQGLSQDPFYLSFGQVVSQKPPVWTGKNFYDDFPILTFWV